MRKLIQEDPFAKQSRGWVERGNWPAQWIDYDQSPPRESRLTLYRLPFELKEPATVIIHVSADNRYRLYLDGEHVGRGPERGMPDYWHFETWQLELKAGQHSLCAMCWWLAGDHAPAAQMSIRPGFVVAAEEPLNALISTGIAAWQCAVAPGLDFIAPRIAPAWTGARVRVNAAQYPWGWQTGEGLQWKKPVNICTAQAAGWTFETQPVWQLAPALLPPMMEQPFPGTRVRYVADGWGSYPVKSTLHLDSEAQAWDKMLKNNGNLDIPPHTKRTVILETANYVCAYPVVCVSGGKGARFRMWWAEALFEQPEARTKGLRNVVEGKYFIGEGDEFLPDGSARRTFTTLWWELGRYVEVLVETADQAISIHSVRFDETRYPLEIKGSFESSEKNLNLVTPVAIRSLLMSSHENYSDGPYYEQIMYIGDTRLESLVTYVVSGDGRLARKALLVFDRSRMPSGLTQSRYPCRIRQVIPPFSLWYVTMAHDYFMWQNDPEFVRRILPGLRAITDAFRGFMHSDGLVHSPEGWNFVDWVPDWTNYGMPSGADTGASSIINLQFVLALQAKAQIEEYFKEPLLAKRDRETASALFDAILQHFQGSDCMLADDLEHEHHSEHAQCLAILTGLMSIQKQEEIADCLLTAVHLPRTTVYFSHYLFEALRLLGRVDKILDRMSLWYKFTDQGFLTTPEQPEPTRSDCHGWGAHPIYHFHATFAGIRPAEPFFRSVEIAPLPGTLTSIRCETAHPDGMISLRLDRTADTIAVAATLPPGLTGSFHWNKKSYALRPGINNLTVSA